MQPIDQVKMQLAMLLPCLLHSRHFPWNEALDDSVGVPDSIMCPVPGRDQGELARGGRQCSFDLLQGILLQAVQDDEAHFIPEPGEAAELIEDAIAPEEVVGVRRQLVAIRAEPEPRVRAMVIEVSLDDAVL